MDEARRAATAQKKTWAAVRLHSRCRGREVPRVSLSSGSERSEAGGDCSEEDVGRRATAFPLSRKRSAARLAVLRERAKRGGRRLLRRRRGPPCDCIPAVAEEKCRASRCPQGASEARRAATAQKKTWAAERLHSRCRGREVPRVSLSSGSERSEAGGDCSEEDVGRRATAFPLSRKRSAARLAVLRERAKRGGRRLLRRRRG